MFSWSVCHWSTQCCSHGLQAAIYIWISRNNNEIKWKVQFHSLTGHLSRALEPHVVICYRTGQRRCGIFPALLKVWFNGAALEWVVPFCPSGKNWQHSWLKLRLFFTDKEINLARHFFYVYLLKVCVCVCVCVRSFLPFTFSFWHKFWVSHFSWAPRGVSQRGWRYYHCVFYQETFSEKISTAGKWWPLLEALLISCSPKKNSVPLLNMHLCYLLPTWAEFTKKKRSQQGQDQRAGKSGHILRVTAACQAWGGGDALCGTWGLWVGVLLGRACPRGVVGVEGRRL